MFLLEIGLYSLSCVFFKDLKFCHCVISFVCDLLQYSRNLIYLHVFFHLTFFLGSYIPTDDCESYVRTDDESALATDDGESYVRTDDESCHRTDDDDAELYDNHPKVGRIYTHTVSAHVCVHINKHTI